MAVEQSAANRSVGQIPVTGKNTGNFRSIRIIDGGFSSVYAPIQLNSLLHGPKEQGFFGTVSGNF
jgi:hypothetical protein